MDRAIQIMNFFFYIYRFETDTLLKKKKKEGYRAVLSETFLVSRGSFLNQSSGRRVEPFTWKNASDLLSKTKKGIVLGTVGLAR